MSRKQQEISVSQLDDPRDVEYELVLERPQLRRAARRLHRLAPVPDIEKARRNTLSEIADLVDLHVDELRGRRP